MAESSGLDSKPEARTKKSIAPHPKFVDMVIEAIQNENKRKGASFVAIKSFIADKYKTVNVKLMKWNVRKAITKGMATGIIIRPKASEEARGLAGRFKVDKAKLAAMNKPKKPSKTKAAKTSKPKVKKIVKTSAKSPQKLKTPQKSVKQHSKEVVKRNTPTRKAKPASVRTKAKPAGKAVSPKAGAKATTTKKATAKNEEIYKNGIAGKDARIENVVMSCNKLAKQAEEKLSEACGEIEKIENSKLQEVTRLEAEVKKQKFQKDGGFLKRLFNTVCSKLNFRSFK